MNVMSQKGMNSPVLNDQQYDNTKLANYVSLLRKKYSLNRKVLLVQAPQFLFESLNIDVARNKGCYAYPPAGLQCIAKALSGRDLEIEILDLNYEFLKRVICEPLFEPNDWLDILKTNLENIRPSIVGVTALSVYRDVFAPGYPLTSIMEFLRREDKYIILAGGPIANNEYENYLKKDYCHFVIEGEGENKINMLFDYLYESEFSGSSLKGIYFKYDGKQEETSGHEDVVTLKGNLISTYDLIHAEDYNKVGSLNPYSRMQGQDRRFSTIQLVRGCRANCKFCGVRGYMGNVVRHYPVKDLLDEIEFLVEKNGIRHFDVLDDDFLKDREAVIELLKGLIPLRQKYRITWSSNNGLIAASITEEVMSLMRDSGCVGFRIGVETGNDEMLRKMRKPASMTSLRNAGAILNKFPEMFTGGNYIIGLLGEETFGEMLATFKFSCELDLDWASFAVFQFTSESTNKAENLKPDGRTTTDFVPSKSSAIREISNKKGVVSGTEVFKLPEYKVPSPEQLNQIWFAFNFVGNYINNKNLKQGGRPEKFTSWVEAVMVAYPLNPYMPLFAAIGRVLIDDRKYAQKHLEKTKMIIEKSEYWNDRFSQFGLNDFVTDFPEEVHAVYGRLAGLRKQYSNWIV